MSTRFLKTVTMITALGMPAGAYAMLPTDPTNDPSLEVQKGHHAFLVQKADADTTQDPSLLHTVKDQLSAGAHAVAHDARLLKEDVKEEARTLADKASHLKDKAKDKLQEGAQIVADKAAHVKAKVEGKVADGAGVVAEEARGIQVNLEAQAAVDAQGAAPVKRDWRRWAANMLLLASLGTDVYVTYDLAAIQKKFLSQVPGSPMPNGILSHQVGDFFHEVKDGLHRKVGLIIAKNVLRYSALLLSPNTRLPALSWANLKKAPHHAEFWLETVNIIYDFIRITTIRAAISSAEELDTEKGAASTTLSSQQDTVLNNKLSWMHNGIGSTIINVLSLKYHTQF